MTLPRFHWRFGPGNTILVPLTKGMEAIIDVADFRIAVKHLWCTKRPKKSQTFYAMTHIRKPDGSRSTVYLHQLLVGNGCDHINRNGLDCRRSNLRPATQSQQNSNNGRQKNNRSGYRGVCRSRRSDKWRANICVNRKQVYLGSFASAVDAAKAYDVAAVRFFGEYACLNFPTRGGEA
jgi:hypothetical protein